MGTFFFQAEDGIRVYKVTGVQTCALPISLPYLVHLDDVAVGVVEEDLLPAFHGPGAVVGEGDALVRQALLEGLDVIGAEGEIGRASCRERVWTSGARGATGKETVSIKDEA